MSNSAHLGRRGDAEGREEGPQAPPLLILLPPPQFLATYAPSLGFQYLLNADRSQ